MTITKQEIEHLAKLSRLELSDEEISRFSSECGAILDYVASLQKVDTQNTEPISQITGLENRQREDQMSEFKNIEGIFKNAPEREGDFFKIKTVFGKKK